MSYRFSDVSIRELEDMTVASAHVISANPEEEVIGFLNNWATKENISIEGHKFGFDVPVSEDDRKKGLRGYEYWICLNKEVPAPEGIEVKKIDGGKYAVLRITNPFEDPFESIPKGWGKLAEWVKNEGYGCEESCERSCLEEVTEEDGVTYMDLYIPIT